MIEKAMIPETDVRVMVAHVGLTYMMGVAALTRGGLTEEQERRIAEDTLSAMVRAAGKTLTKHGVEIYKGAVQ